MQHARAVLSCLVLSSAAALAAQAPGPQQAASTTRPVPMPKASNRAMTVWAFSRSQVIERLCERLRGASSLRAWRFSKEVLARACDDEEVQDALIEYFERSLLTKGEDSMARNAIEVMRRSKNKRFAPVLLRASRHSLRTIAEDAIAGLESCGDEASIAALMKDFTKRSLRSQVLVMRVLARRGKAETAVPFFRKLIEGQITLTNVVDLTASTLEIFQKQTPAAVVAGTLRGKLSLFPKTAGEVAARLLHESGEDEGRRALLRALAAQKDPKRAATIVEALALRDAAASLDAVLERCAESDDASLRAALARFLGKVEDHDDGASNAVAMLEVLATDRVRGVEVEAMAALRGRSESSTARLLSSLESASGSKLRLLIELLMRAPEKRAVPILARRLASAKGRDRQLFIQILGRMGLPEALPLLEAEFRRDPIRFGRDADSIAYAAIVTTNIYESESMLWKVYEKTDARSAQGLALRSHLLKTLANLAKAPGKGRAGRLERIHGRFRKILFDPKALPDERIRVLDYLRGASLTIDDALRLGRKMRRQGDFAPDELKGRFNNYLHEFF